MTHEELRELIPAYALDALGPEEARDLEAHLPGCPACQDELTALRDVAASLATGVAAVGPPAELAGRILDAVRPTRREPVGRRGWALVLAAAAVAIVVLGALDLSLERRLAAFDARAAVETQMLTMLASPNAGTVALTGSVPGSVRLVFDRATGHGALVVSGLRDPGKEFVYQVWLVAGTVPKSAGVFRPAPDQPMMMMVGPDVTRYRAVAISVERGPGGAPGPTSAPVLVGTIPGSG